MKFLIDTYDRIAPYYGKKNFGPFWKREFPIFQKLIKGKKIVDLGCGTGRDAVIFLKHKFDYLGIDLSPGMLKEAKKRAPRGKFKVMDLYKLKLPKESFDGFWASASFLHIPKKRIGTVLRSARALLKDDGVGFISVKEKKKLGEEIIKKDMYDGRVKDTKRFFANYTKMEFTQLLERNGFKLVRFTRKWGPNTKAFWLCFFVKKV